MKKITMMLTALSMAVLTSCGGMSAEEKNQKIEEAATLRAKQFCESTDGSNGLAMYGEKLAYLTEQLAESGITSEEDLKKATDLFDKKIKESCPDKAAK